MDINESSTNPAKVDLHHGTNHNHSNVVNNNGMSQFLRNFSNFNHQKAHRDQQQNVGSDVATVDDTLGTLLLTSSHQLQQQSSPIVIMKKSHRLLRSLTTRNHQPSNHTKHVPPLIVQHDGIGENISPVSVTSTDNAFQQQRTTATKSNVGTKGKLRLGSFRNAEEQITFQTVDDSTTRLGICPTCYEVSDSTNAVNTDSATPSSAATTNSTMTLSVSTSSLSNSTFTIPNLFSGVAIWEESCTLDEFISGNKNNRNALKQHQCGVEGESPQKSLSSFDDNKSSSLDGSFIMDDDEEMDKTRYRQATSSNSSICSITNNSINGATRTIRNKNGKNIRKSGDVTGNKNSLINKAKSIVQRAREKGYQNGQCNNSTTNSNNGRETNSCNSSVVSAASTRSNTSYTNFHKKKSRSYSNSTTGSNDNVKIYLLLVEPKTKVFELIQLLYPRNTTRVIDLLHMIPKHATEPILAQQTYIGITRPKRRSEPVVDVSMYASNTICDTSTYLPSTIITANIEPGEIIVALPQFVNIKELISLSKQILASSHIQQLIVITSTTSSNKCNTIGGTDQSMRNCIKDEASSDCHQKTKQRSNSKVKTIPSSMSIATTISATLSEDSQTSFTTTTNNTYAEYSTSRKKAVISPVVAHGGDEVTKSPKVVSFVIDRNNQKRSCEEVLDSQQVTIKSFSSPEKRTVSSSSVVTTDLCVNLNTCIKDNFDDEFPFRNMIDAYISKDAVVKLCSTPNDSKKSSMFSDSMITESHISTLLVDSDEANDKSFTVVCCDDDGSITSTGSSYNSWANHSLDNSSIPSLTRRVALRLQSQHVAIPSQYLKKKTRFFNKKKTKRAAIVIFLSSIIRYHLDSNGKNGADDHRLRRSKIAQEPMGYMGFLLLIFAFALFVKLQKIYRRRANSNSVTAKGVQKARCPVLKSVSKLQRKLVSTLCTDSSSNDYEDDAQHNSSLVPSSIHAIHFQSSEAGGFFDVE